MFKILFFILFSTALVYSQNSTISWLDNNVRPIKSHVHSDSFSDLHFLAEILKNKSIIGLGEASHGTEEFYAQKTRIVQYLIQKLNYRILAIEMTTEKAELINQYVNDESCDLKSILKKSGLYNSRVMYDLCVWLKDFNKNRINGDKVRLIGFDSEAFWYDPTTRDEGMAELFIEKYAGKNTKTILWAHNLHIAKDKTMTRYNAMGYYLARKYGDLFYAVGFDTYKGSVHVLDKNGKFEKHFFEGNENTFSNLFAKSKHSMFFLDFNTSNNPLKNKINKITNLYSNWQTPAPLLIKISSDFDALIFIRETTASVGLQ